MNVILMLGIFIIGSVSGYALSGLLSANRHTEELEQAYENGKKFERMRITQVIDNDTSK